MRNFVKWLTKLLSYGNNARCAIHRLKRLAFWEGDGEGFSKWNIRIRVSDEENLGVRWKCLWEPAAEDFFDLVGRAALQPKIAILNWGVMLRLHEC